MKRTIIMLSIIGTILLTWMSLALIGYLLSDLTYKECMVHGATLMIMTIFGWVPAVIVAVDLDKVIAE